MDNEVQRIHRLFGELSDAFWKRMTQNSTGSIAPLLKPGYEPESDKEKSIWSNLTSPENRTALHSYVAFLGDIEVNERATTIIQAALNESENRWGLSKQGGVGLAFEDHREQDETTS